MSKRKQYPLRVTCSARGIRAQDLRILSQRSWWARRWITCLEKMQLGSRLGRGRQYAIQGQVTSLEMEGSHVEAQITGSRDYPYTVTLDFTALKEKGAERILKKFKNDPILPARILTDDLPIEMEELFHKEGVSLFPSQEFTLDANGKRHYDITMRCSCPDWMRPCKHIVAVMLLLGEEISHRPATLLALRGLDIDEMFSGSVGSDVSESSLKFQPAIEVAQSIVSKNSILDPAPLLSRLGAIPFWRGTSKCVETLRRSYSRAQPIAQDATNGKPIDLRGFTKVIRTVTKNGRVTKEYSL